MAGQVLITLWIAGSASLLECSYLLYISAKANSVTHLRGRTMNERTNDTLFSLSGVRIPTQVFFI